MRGTRELESGSRRKNIINKIQMALALSLVLYFVFLSGYLLGQKTPLSSRSSRVVNTDSGKPAAVDFSLYWEAWNKLKEKSVIDLEDKKLLEGSISGMVSSLGDPYTSFLSKEDNERFKEDIAGEFGGIGIEIVMKNNLPTVASVLDESPAKSAGMKAGDIIAEVDGTKTTEIGFDQTINLIRGEKGTTVKLMILREGSEELKDFSIVRDIIVVKSVKDERKNYQGKDILYVKISQFGDDTNRLFNEVIKKVNQDKPDGIIIDLRNNPGGYLETSIDLASYFIDGGVIVSEKGKDGKSRDYKTTNKAKLKNIKLVVLVNKYSASASEIFAGAVQDRGVGELVGEKTFGKGSVQELVDLSDGSAVKVTIAKWLTPKGRQINDQGIEPNVNLIDIEETPADEQLDKALEIVAK